MPAFHSSYKSASQGTYRTWQWRILLRHRWSLGARDRCWSAFADLRLLGIAHRNVSDSWEWGGTGKSHKIPCLWPTISPQGRRYCDYRLFLYQIKLIFNCLLWLENYCSVWLEFLLIKITMFRSNMSKVQSFLAIIVGMACEYNRELYLEHPVVLIKFGRLVPQVWSHRNAWFVLPFNIHANG